MTLDAISSIERAHIVHELDTHGKWTAKRMGTLVEMARFRSRADPNVSHRIYYSVTLAGQLVVSARADTVDLAIDDINQIIHGHPPQLSARAVQCARGAV